MLIWCERKITAGWLADKLAEQNEVIIHTYILITEFGGIINKGTCKKDAVLL